MQSLTQGIDVSAIRTVLSLLRERRVFITRVNKSSRDKKYAYLTIPKDVAVMLGIKQGDCFKPVIRSGYIEYIPSDTGYAVSARRKGGSSYVIKFPIDEVEGYAILEVDPERRSFRVYF